MLLFTKINTLTKENTELKKRVDGLMQQPSAVKQDPGRTVVVGDRLVKDLDERKLEHTKVRYQRDTRITNAMAKVKNLPGNYHHNALVIGGTDCHGADRPSATHIVDSYCHLVDTAKEKVRIVTVASIPPRTASDDTHERNNVVNTGLTVMCNEKDVKFSNNDPYVVFSDDSVNEGYLETDGTHLTRGV